VVKGTLGIIYRRLALRFMDTIDGEIDFCFIDTAHVNPGEIFDVLMVLPI
jgi:hypothetical protein